MHCRIGLTIVLALATASGSAQSVPAQISSFLDDQVIAVARIRLDRGDFGRLRGGEEAGTTVGRLGSRVASVAEQLRKAGARDLYLIVTLDASGASFGPGVSAVVPVLDGVDVKAVGETLCGVEGPSGRQAWKTCATIRGVVFAGDDEALARAKSLRAVERPDVAAALEAGGDSPYILAVTPPVLLRRIVDELAPTLPAVLGSAQTSILTKGFGWASVAVRPGEASAVRMIVKASDAASAKALLDLGGKLVATLSASAEVSSIAPDFAAKFADLAPRVEDDRIIIEMDGPKAIAWSRAVFDPILDRSARAESVTKMKTMGLAMHNYHSAHKTFPPAYSTDAAGKPLLSWRVLILPYLDEDSLYKEFHLDEPWDSPHNKTLIARMPAIYDTGSLLDAPQTKGLTGYLTPRSPDAAFPGAKGLELKEFTDGTSNTLMVLETPADGSVTWTSPSDWDVAATLDPRAVLSRHVGGAYATMMDGSVRFLRDSIKPEILKQLITRAGGEPIPEQEF